MKNKDSLFNIVFSQIKQCLVGHFVKIEELSLCYLCRKGSNVKFSLSGKGIISVFCSSSLLLIMAGWCIFCVAHQLLPAKKGARKTGFIIVSVTSLPLFREISHYNTSLLSR